LNDRVIESRSVSSVSSRSACRPVYRLSTPLGVGLTISESGARASVFSEISPRSTMRVGLRLRVAGRLSTIAQN